MFKANKKSAGFTIIEMLLVLAAAGMMMLAVFLAVPAVQRNSRNSARKSDVAIVLGKMNDYIVKKNGTLPPTCTDTPPSSPRCTTVFLKDTTLNQYETDRVVFCNQPSCTAPMPGSEADFVGIENYIAIYNKTSCKDNKGVASTGRAVAALFVIETKSGYSMQCLELN
jgi:prepilin-type N-terminal cleavage/methylation domain-containing protein